MDAQRCHRASVCRLSAFGRTGLQRGRAACPIHVSQPVPVKVCLQASHGRRNGSGEANGRECHAALRCSGRVLYESPVCLPTRRGLAPRASGRPEAQGYPPARYGFFDVSAIAPGHAPAAPRSALLAPRPPCRERPARAGVDAASARGDRDGRTGVFARSGQSRGAPPGREELGRTLLHDGLPTPSGVGVELGGLRGRDAGGRRRSPAPQRRVLTRTKRGENGRGMAGR